MNCQDMNHLLDSSAKDLTPAQRESIDQHLASCHACSEDWANWREMAALPVPATPAGLRGRVAMALPVQLATPVRRSFRPYVVAGVLLACAAAAAMLVVQFAGHELESASASVDSSQVASSAVQDSGESRIAPTAPLADLPQGSDTIAVTDKPVTAAAVPMDPHAIVVLLRPEAAADLRAVAIARQCHNAIVRQLRAVKGLNVLADAAVSAYEGDEQASRLDPGPIARFKLRSSDQEIARKLGAGNVLVVTTDNYCAASQFNSQTGDAITGLMSGTALPPEDGWNAFATSLAHNVRDKTLVDESALLAGYRKTLLDTALSDRERVSALSGIANFGGERGKKVPRSAFDKEVIAAVVQIGARSSDADARSSAWTWIGGVDDSSLVQPLLQALANDPDATVRMHAAFSLNTFLDVPGVREALLRAAAEDPSREPEVACCIYTVREAAERASIADKDLKTWMRNKLLNENLPARSRLLNVQYSVPDGRFQMLSKDDLGAEVARVVFDIGRNEQNPRVRQMAWTTLERMAPNEAFVPVLLGDLTSHPDEYVRYAAAKVLKNYVGNPSVREALERARSDSSMSVRREAGAATGTSGN